MSKVEALVEENMRLTHEQSVLYLAGAQIYWGISVPPCRFSTRHFEKVLCKSLGSKALSCRLHTFLQIAHLSSPLYCTFHQIAI